VLKSPVPGETIKPAEKCSFYEVTRNLDPGGSFYMYLSTEQIIKKVEELIENIKLMAISDSQDPAKKNEAGPIVDIVSMVLKESGLFEISGVGLSSVAMDNGFSHSKMVIHHYRGKDDGLIWNLMEEGSDALDSQKLLPANTAFAAFSNQRPGYFWEWLNKKAKENNFAGLQKMLDGLRQMLKTKEIDLDKIIASLNGKKGIIVTLDETKMNKIPAMGQTLEIPDPAVALVFYIEDETIFNMMQKLIPIPPQVTGKVKKIAGPVLPMPVTLAPMIVQRDNLLIFATSGKIVDDIFACRDGAKGLLAADEFKKLLVYMPEKGDGFSFLSAKIFNIITDIQEKASAAASEEAKSSFDALKRLNLFPKDLSFYNVIQNTDEGFVFSSNNNLPLAAAAVMPAVTVVGVVAAIAIPNLVRKVEAKDAPVPVGKN
jgi:hypothetical protein